MQRLNKHQIATVRGETDENIFDQEEVFGVPFGAAGLVRQTFGSDDPSQNSGTICIRLKTGNLSEVNVGYEFRFSNMSRIILKGVWYMTVSEAPWSRKGDAGIVAEGEYDVMNFLSADGKDPREGYTRKGYVPSPAGGGYAMGDIDMPPRPDGGYRPNMEYYLTVRCKFEDGLINPITFSYRGSDDEEHGGEQLILNEDLFDKSEAIPMSFGDMNGVFIPDA